jgi:Fe-S-cluster containining protein
MESQRRMLPVVPASTGQSLCLRCGLCCDGTVFEHVAIEPDELQTMRDAGIEVVAGPPDHFALPCTRFANHTCHIYAQRPRICARYRCRLLKRLESGEIDLEQAHQVVKKATYLAAGLRELLADSTEQNQSVWTSLQAFSRRCGLSLDSTEFSRSFARIGMYALSLRQLVDRELKEGRSLPEKANVLDQVKPKLSP